MNTNFSKHCHNPLTSSIVLTCDLNTNVQKVIEQEQKDYENQIEIENQQATYVPEETYEVEENEAS